MLVLWRNRRKPYPPTAQHTIREGNVLAKNLISTIKGSGEKLEEEVDNKQMISFDYKTKGVMAEIGKRIGVGDLLGFKIHGFTAWCIWRTYYLENLPTVEKNLRVMVDWKLDLLFKLYVTRLGTFAEEKEEDLSPRTKKTEEFLR